MTKNNKKIKCEYYCGKIAKYRQDFTTTNRATGEIETVWQRYACEDCKDHSED